MNINSRWFSAETRRRFRALQAQGSNYVAKVRGEWAVAGASPELVRLRMRDEEPGWELWRIDSSGGLRQLDQESPNG